MRIKNIRLSITWKGLFGGLTLAAIIIDLGVFRRGGGIDWWILNYYTLLSNIACCAFLATSHLVGERAMAALGYAIRTVDHLLARHKKQPNPKQ